MRPTGALKGTGSVSKVFTIRRTIRENPDNPEKVKDTHIDLNVSGMVERQIRSPKIRTKRDVTGWRRPTSYYRTIITASSGGGVVTDVLSNGNLQIWEGNAPPFHANYSHVNLQPMLKATLRASINLNLQFRADTEALVKVKDMQVNYGEALAEARSTIGHLAKTSKSLLQAYLSARRGDWMGVAKALDVRPKQLRSGKSASSRWLEYQFGWMPLLGDIHGSMDLLNKGFRERDFTFSVVREIRGGGVDLPAPTGASVRVTGSAKRLVKTKLYCKIRNQSLTNLTRMGLLDPLQVAWALVPFSFVVDWVLPVGSFLEALSATHGVDFIGGTRTNRLVFDLQAYSRPTANQQNVVSRSGYFMTSYRGLAMERDALASFPRPALFWKSPFSTSHVISALALFRQLKR